MRKLILLSALLAMGCGKNNPSKAVPPAFYDAPQGAFEQTQELPPTDTTRFTVGCKEGTTTPIPQIDSRLQAGTVVTSYYKFHNGASVISASAQETVLVSASNMETAKYEILGASGISGISTGFTAAKTCGLKEDGTYNCILDPAPPNPANHKCTILSGKNVTDNIDKQYAGKHTFADGKTVSAFKVVKSITGNITCDGKFVGPGIMKSVVVYSNDVPAEGTAQFCGGVEVYSSVSFKKITGPLIMGHVKEKTSIK